MSTSRYLESGSLTLQPGEDGTFIVDPLCCGVHKADGSVDRTAVIRKLTPRVRVRLAEPSAQNDNLEAGNILLRESLVEVGGEKPTGSVLDRLYNGDRDLIQMAARQISMGNTVTYQPVTCPGCRGRYHPVITIDNMEVFRVNPDEVEAITDPAGNPALGFRVESAEHEIEAVVRFSQGRDQKAVEKVRRNFVAALHRMICECVHSFRFRGEEIEHRGAALQAWVESPAGVPMDAWDWLTEEIMDHQPGPDLVNFMACPDCGRRELLDLGASDFLVPTPRGRRR